MASDARQETLAVIAEMRDEAARADTEQYYTLDDAAESMREYANRLEAALKREPVTDCNHTGNAAAMREALVEIRDTINKWYGDDYISHGAFSALWDLCSDALSAPARNCDVMSRSNCTVHFSTTYEGNRDGLCDVQTEREKNIHLYYMELIDWLLAPAAERKGDGDGR